MIVNKFPGRCSCGAYVQREKGYVSDRKITCMQCVPILGIRGSDFQYQGCGTDEESMSEWHADHFENESHYVGFEVGDQ